MFLTSYFPPSFLKSSNIPQPIFHDVVKHLTFGIYYWSWPSLTFQENHPVNFISNCRLPLEILVCHKLSIHGDVVTGIPKILWWGHTFICIKIKILLFYNINFLLWVILLNCDWSIFAFSTTKFPFKIHGLVILNFLKYDKAVGSINYGI